MQTNFIFRLYGTFPVWAFFETSRHVIDQSKLGKAQIEARDQIKIFDFASWGLGSLGSICGHLGSNYKNFQTWTSYIPNETLRPLITKKWFSGSVKVIKLIIVNIWGQNQNIFKQGEIMYQNEALDPVVKKRRSSRSSEVDRLQIEGYLGSFGLEIKNFSKQDNLYTKMMLLLM